MSGTPNCDLNRIRERLDYLLGSPLTRAVASRIHQELRTAPTSVMWELAARRPAMRRAFGDKVPRVKVVKYGKRTKLVLVTGRKYIAALTWRGLARKALLGPSTYVSGSQLQRRGIL